MTNLLLDSWAFIEIFKGGSKADKIKSITQNKPLFTTTLNLYEVFYRMNATHNEQVAEETIQSITSEVTVIGIEPQIAVEAAKNRASLKSKSPNLSAIDIITYAAAKSVGATLITGDIDFKNVPGVILF